MQYFAFVRRDGDKHYSATLPDFPGCVAKSPRLAGLVDAIQAAVGAHVDGAFGAPPRPTGAEGLPRSDDDHDGYWLMVDLASVFGTSR